MKKSLSLLLAIALVFGMFYSVAAAATPTPAEAGQQLKDYGIIEGSNGDLMVDSTWLRQDAVVVLSRLLGAEADAKAHANDHGFTDVKGSFYNGYISWAKEEKYIKGNNAAGTTFGFDKKLSNQEFAAIILRVFGIDDYDNAVAKGIEFGILPADAKADAPATRGDTFVGIVAALDVEVPGTGKKLGAILELPGFDVAVGVAKVTATGAKKLAVEFNQAVDTEKATFTVKKGAAPVNVSAKSFSDDKKTATLELATRLTEGDYTVTVGGLTDADLTATVKAVDEKVAKIELSSDTLALGALPNTSGAEKAYISYKVLNQYNEDITKAATTPDITWTASKGSASDDNQGQLTLDTGVANTFYNLTELVVLTGIEQNSSVVVNATLKVGNKSSVDTVEFQGVWENSGAELNTDTVKSKDFFVLFTAKDQYGNSVANANYIYNDLIITSSNPGVVQVLADTVDPTNNITVVGGVGPDSDKIGIQLTDPVGTGFDGTATIRVLTKNFGKSYSFDVNVKKASTVDTIQLQVPTSTIAIGDDVEIPFTAADQNGAAVTSHSALNGPVTLTSTAGTGKLRFVEDLVNKKSVLKFDASGLAEGKYVLMAYTPSGKSSQITVEVKKARVPSVIAATKDLTTNLVKGATLSVKDANIVVQDQYGKEVTLDTTFFTNYRIELTPNDGNADKVTGIANIVADDTAITLTAANKGTERVKAVLYSIADSKVVPGSDFLFNVVVVEKSDVSEYAVDDIAKVNRIDTNHNVSVNVYGKLANGSKVVLPSDMYTVNTTIDGLVYSGGKLDATATDATYISNDTKEATGNVIVVIDTASGAQDIVKPVVVSKADLAITTVEGKDITTPVTLKNNGTLITGAATDITVANLFSTLKFKDQYGVEISVSSSDVYKTITNLSDADNDSSLTVGTGTNGTVGATITGVERGDSFTITFLTKNGVKIVLKVVADA